MSNTLTDADSRRALDLGMFQRPGDSKQSQEDGSSPGDSGGPQLSTTAGLSDLQAEERQRGHRRTAR